VEPRVVQASHGSRLAPVPAREHHHVTAALAKEALERIVRLHHGGPPAGRLLGASVEPVHEGQEIPELPAVARVNNDLVGRTRLADAKSQRGVEVAGLEEEQPVHGGRPTLPWRG
jgi:hypothetical protein